MQKSTIKDEPQLEVITTDSEIPIRCFISEDHGSYIPLHYHPAIELIYVLEGTVGFSVSNSSEENSLLSTTLTQGSLIPDPRINKLPMYQPVDLPRYKFAQLTENTSEADSGQALEQDKGVQDQSSSQDQTQSHSHKSFKVLGDLPEPLQGVLFDDEHNANATRFNEDNKGGTLETKNSCVQEELDLDKTETTSQSEDKVLSFAQVLRASEYNCVIFNSDELHSTHCPKYNRSLVVQIPFEFLTKSLGIAEGNKVYFALAEASEECLLKLQQALSKLTVLTMQEHSKPEEFARTIHFQQALYSVLECLIEFMLIIPSSSLQHAESGKFKERVYTVLDFIEQHYTEEIYLQDVAQNLLHVHPNYLCRIFKKVVGRSFYAYLTEVRLSHVYQDLISTTEPITKIIERNGLTVNNYFYTLFKKRFDIGPSELRQRHNQLEQAKQ